VGKMKKILIPVENQQRIDEPLEIAVEIAKKFGSTVTIFHAVDFHKIPNEVKYGAYIEKIYETANKNNFMDKVVKLYENEGIETNFKVIEGDAASEIIDEAEKGDYDLVIMETHSMKENKRFLLGSVTNKVVHHIKVPVLVVK
jgi:nucleotide-binding universal stress UspA family protein